ncbi:CHAT domain-containing protein [Nocardia sp. MW-W600-9]
MRFRRRKTENPKLFNLGDMQRRTERLGPLAAAARKTRDAATVTQFCMELREEIAELMPHAGSRAVTNTLVDFMRWYILLLADLPTPPWSEIGRFGLVQSGFYSQAVSVDPPNRDNMTIDEVEEYTQLIYALMQAQRSVQDIAAFAAHKRGFPTHAGLILEYSTGATFHATQIATSVHALGPHGPEGHDQNIAEQVATEQFEIVGSTAVEDFPLDIGPLDQSRQLFQDFLASRINSTFDLPKHHQLFAAHAWHCTSCAAAVASGRDLLYIVSTHRGSAAIRYPSQLASSSKPESVDLPELSIQQVLRWAEGLTEIYARYRRLEVRKRDLQRVIDDVLDGVGSQIIAPVLEAWPQMDRACFVPVGAVAALPFTAASVKGKLACALLDFTIAPSAMSLHAADGYPIQQIASATVAVDPSEGKDHLKYTLIEADRIAEIHQVTVRNVRSAASAPVDETYPVDFPRARLLENDDAVQESLPPASAKELVTTLSRCSIAHLACHGLVTDFPTPNAHLVLGQGLSLNDYLTGCEPIAPGGTVVLSACSVGGVVQGAPSEIFGFPTVLLSSGSRNVIAPICPVLDSTETVELMCAIHRGLAQGESPTYALKSAIELSRDAGVSSAIWGIFNCNGQ